VFMNHAHNTELIDLLRMTSERLSQFTNDKVTNCVACIRLFCIGPCQVQQRRRSRAQTQHEGGSRDLYPDHEERAWMPSVPYALVLRIR
jgi:hypothetical protein